MVFVTEVLFYELTKSLLSNILTLLILSLIVFDKIR